MPPRTLPAPAQSVCEPAAGIGKAGFDWNGSRPSRESDIFKI
jgi:hypothetical protein